jgi:hypothetical protein
MLSSSVILKSLALPNFIILYGVGDDGRVNIVNSSLSPGFEFRIPVFILKISVEVVYGDPAAGPCACKL